MFAPITPGTPVEVRSTFDRGWKRGFTVADCDRDGEDRPTGYVLRRLSDGSVLPATFGPDAVRPLEGGAGASIRSR